MAQLILPRFPNAKFRILITGWANAGKTSIIDRVAYTMESPEIYKRDKSGECKLVELDPSIKPCEHNIEDELFFTNHDEYVFHDSRGFEAGDEHGRMVVQDFVRKKSSEKRLEDKLHAIWYCVPMDNCYNNRPGLDLKHFAGIRAITNVPMIVVFTKYDEFKRKMALELEDMDRDRALAGAEMERILYEHYLSCLSRSTPFVCLEKMHKPSQR